MVAGVGYTSIARGGEDKIGEESRQQSGRLLVHLARSFTLLRMIQPSGAATI